MWLLHESVFELGPNWRKLPLFSSVLHLLNGMSDMLFLDCSVMGDEV